MKVKGFVLTLVGEARNWYATLEPVVMTWPELQNMFRHQYSKIGNTENSCFMLGDHFIMMKMWKLLMHMLLE